MWGPWEAANQPDVTSMIMDSMQLLAKKLRRVRRAKALGAEDVVFF